ncbi:MAG: hypothetical protein LBI18_14950 [Planctomycetaceae bacterium]|jgi:hypothetical protein|nr:hypothetical protein [Planctomycetaceae bacterium]
MTKEKNKNQIMLKVIVIAMILFPIIALRQFWLPDALKSIPERMIFSEKLYTRRDGLKDYLYPELWSDYQKNLCLIDKQYNIILIISPESGLFLLDDEAQTNIWELIDCPTLSPGKPRKIIYKGVNGFCFRVTFSLNCIIIEHVENSINIPLQQNEIVIVRTRNEILKHAIKAETGNKLRTILEKNSQQGDIPDNILNYVDEIENTM